MIDTLQSNIIVPESRNSMETNVMIAATVLQIVDEPPRNCVATSFVRPATAISVMVLMTVLSTILLPVTGCSDRTPGVTNNSEKVIVRVMRALTGRRYVGVYCDVVKEAFLIIIMVRFSNSIISTMCRH